MIISISSSYIKLLVIFRRYTLFQGSSYHDILLGMGGTSICLHILCVDTFGMTWDNSVPYQQLVGTPVRTSKANHILFSIYTELYPATVISSLSGVHIVSCLCAVLIHPSQRNLSITMTRQ